jgi:peptidoglycan/xylan/chitin deacetylase (PgdA/CDA1 family)
MKRTRVVCSLLVVGSLLLVACRPAPAPPSAPTATPDATPTATPVATHTAALPTNTPVPTPTSTPTVPHLTWEQLKAATYVLPERQGGPPDGLLPMEDGAFTFAYVPGAASVERYLLYRGVAFGDLNADQVEDAVVILIHSSAGSGTFYHLAVVLNDRGQPRPLAPVFLGDRIIVEGVDVARSEIQLLFKTYRPEEPFGSTPTLQMAQRYRLVDETLELVHSGALNADDVVNDTITADMVRIVFPPGTASASYSGRTRPFGLDPYTLQAQAGQALTVTVTSSNDDAFLSIYGTEEPDVLVRAFEEVSSWSWVVPATQEYAINVFAIGLETEYSLDVEAASPPATPTPQPEPTVVPPAPTVAPEGGAVVYLTFDDGPIPPYTHEMLQLLSKYGAQATFFVLGQNVERFPELIEEAHEAGHVLGNHTYNHTSLAGISKEDFDSQVQRTAEALGDWAAPCLRPPFGATDAFTRVYAAELGYSVVLWNIDTLDWSRPGTQAIISTILQQVYPEAIVLMHDGGGDREQTVSALETILQQLQARGYTFHSVCPP